MQDQIKSNNDGIRMRRTKGDRDVVFHRPGERECVCVLKYRCLVGTDAISGLRRK